MYKNSRLLAVLLVMLIMIAINTPVNAADKMTYEEYQVQLQSHQDREARAQESIDAENQSIDEINNRIAEIDARIVVILEEIYSTAGVTQEEFDGFLTSISDLEDRFNELEAVNPSQLLEMADDLDVLSDEIDEMMANSSAKIEKANSRIRQLKARLERLKSAIPKPKHDWYSVIRGDYLWRISGKSEIFNDPWKWMRIYSSNREQINDPDLIFPDQRFRIPRQIGRDEHLVAKGEYLSKIAGYNEVYGDPFKWTKIYQANKTSGYMQDPNLIYPEQILTIPND